MNDKSIIIIGNGASLKDSGLGSKIDEFDEVIRINEAKTKEFENDAGMRFTIWSTFNPDKRVMKFIKGYENTYGYSMDEIKELVKDVHEIYYVGARPDCSRPWKSKWVTDIGLQDAVKRHASPVTIRKIKRTIEYPTTGFVLIWLFTHMYDKIYLAGFDFGGITDPSLEFHHYFNQASKYTLDTHNFQNEYEAVNEWIKQGKIEHLKKYTVIQKGKWIGGYIHDYRCDACGNVSDLYSWENRICHYCEEIL